LFGRDPKGSAGGFQIEDCGLMIAKPAFQSSIRNLKSAIQSAPLRVAAKPIVGFSHKPGKREL
jgi:hypothetical protein